MKILDDYFETKKQIFDYFGYKKTSGENWSIMDSRADFWNVVSKARTLRFGKTREIVRNGYDEEPCERHTLYSANCRYSGRHYTMMIVGTGDQVVLQIFDNQKEIKETIIEED